MHIACLNHSNTNETERKDFGENDMISREGFSLELLYFQHKRPVTNLWLIEQLLNFLSPTGSRNIKTPMKANIVFDSKGHLNAMCPKRFSKFYCNNLEVFLCFADKKNCCYSLCYYNLLQNNLICAPVMHF